MRGEVRVVLRLQLLQRRQRRRRRAGLFLRRPLAAALVADARVRAERLEEVGLAGTSTTPARPRASAPPRSRTAAPHAIAVAHFFEPQALRNSPAAASVESVLSRASPACAVSASSPHTRSRATPPSGNTDSRTCVTGPTRRSCSSNTCRVCGCSGLSTTVRQPMSASGFASRGPTARLDETAARRVALEVRGVDLDALHRARRRQADERPVVARAAAALGLPAVAHVHRAVGLDQVVPRAEEHVAARQHVGAVLQRREIHQPAERAQLRPVRHHLAVHAQSRHAAVGEDVEPHVREAPLVGHREVVLRVALQLRPAGRSPPTPRSPIPGGPAGPSARPPRCCTTPGSCRGTTSCPPRSP